MPAQIPILQIAIILAVARVAGFLFRRIGQPQVVGEMFAGILLGPSLLGWIAPGVSAFLFPPGSAEILRALSEVGVLLYMFLVGLALDTSEIAAYGRVAVLISNVGMLAPFSLGAMAAVYLYPTFAPANVSVLSFTLFMGSAMSVTAFPVLARILTERHMLRTHVGGLAISCAAVDDVSGWCILAGIIVTMRSAPGAAPVLLTLLGLAAYVLIMIFGLKRLLRRFEAVCAARGHLSEDLLAVMLLLLFASSMATEALGIHKLFGAFLFGAVMPKNSDFTSYLHDRFESLTVVLLLPLFFAYSGLRTDVTLLSAPHMWFYCIIVLAVASAGKFGGCTIAARFSGLPLRQAAAIGLLMNTRGLMELVILNIGLDIGAITPALFLIMVIMALTTTLMTGPLLGWIYPARYWMTTDGPARQPKTTVGPA